ncbi:hypothetical protein KKB64_01180 [Patescibacteria group bacterium]|nr:hypothetical protein [Patescibacteria group bacterium]MBU1472387.1 hypothetical protein [Patescibacteria group bacterium]MBU2459870.1 hypothetical protein [Patescibacteria group bacterium]
MTTTKETSWLTDEATQLAWLEAIGSYRTDMLSDFVRANAPFGITAERVKGDVLVINPTCIFPALAYLTVPNDENGAMRPEITSISCFDETGDTHLAGMWFSHIPLLYSAPPIRQVVDRGMVIYRDSVIYLLSHTPPACFDAIFCLWQYDFDAMLTRGVLAYAVSALKPGGWFWGSGSQGAWTKDGVAAIIPQETSAQRFVEFMRLTPFGVGFMPFNEGHIGLALRRSPTITEDNHPRHRTESAMQRLCHDADLQMQDPGVIEVFNTSMQISELTDGQRVYQREELNIIQQAIDRAVKEKVVVEDSDIKVQIAKRIFEASCSATREATIQIRGQDAFTMADSIALSMVEASPYDKMGFAQWFEEMIACYLGLLHHIPYQNYQVDISMIGQGLLRETYEITIWFRPIPKNESAGRVHR